MNEERFGSLARVYGRDDFILLQHAHICVVGIGGVGSWSAEALARTGIGKITLIDGDDITRSNINRQCHTLESTLGKMKTTVMKQRILDINPDCECHTIEQFINEDNLSDFIQTDFDCVIDAIDRIKYKAALIYFCRRNKIPVITTGGAGGLTDPAQIRVADLARTWNDPLAASVRLRLRQQYGFSRNLKRSFGVPCIYSTEQQRYPDRDGNVGYKKPGVAGLSLDCSFGYGSVVAVTASFGFNAAAVAMGRVIRKQKKAQVSL